MYFSFKRVYFNDELSKNGQLKSLFSSNRLPLSQSFVASSVSRLSVYYESFYYTHVSENVQITPSNLMGTIGSNKILCFSIKINLYLYLNIFFIKRRSTRLVHWHFASIRFRNSRVLD